MTEPRFGLSGSQRDLLDTARRWPARTLPGEIEGFTDRDTFNRVTAVCKLPAARTEFGDVVDHVEALLRRKKRRTP